MTVSSETSRKTFSGDGVTTSFGTSPMVFFDATDLTVYVVTTATGAVVATLVLNTDYTVTGGDGSTGTLDLSAGSSPYGAPASGTTLVIVREIPATQSSDLVNNDGSDAEVLEAALDRLTMILQQHATTLGRSFTLADSDVSGASTEIPTPAASQLIGWNDTADELQNYSTADLDLALTTAFTLTLLDDANAADFLTTLGVSSFVQTLLNDADADAFVQTLADGATAITSPAAGDIVMLSDVSETPDDGRKITLENMLKVVNDLTEDTAPVAADFLLSYDVSASAAKKVKPENLPVVARQNFLVNGAMSISQLNSTFTAATLYPNSDDNYTLDQWLLLSDGNDIVDVSQVTTPVPTGSGYACALDVETANKKFGILQPIEWREAVRIIGGTVSLSFKARKGGSNATVGTMRAAVVSWDGTADSITSDIISAWNATDTNPTLVANWTYENTPADLTLTTSYQTFTIEGISLDTANAKNVGVFLYYNKADGTVGDFIYVTDVQLEPGNRANEFLHRSFAEETVRCQRFLEKSYDLTTAIGTATTAGSETFDASGTGADYTIQYLTRKRVAPSIVGYNTNSGSSGTWRNNTLNADEGFNVTFIGEARCECNFSTTDTNQINGHWVADARL